MKIIKENPEKVAKQLIKIGFTVNEYEELQKKRKARLIFWNNIGVEALIKNEESLINFGEEVLKLLKEVQK